MEGEAIIGVDLGGTKVSAGRVRGARIVKHFSAGIDNKAKRDQILNDIIHAIESVFEPAVAGIGLGVPSIVDIERGIVYDVQNIPSWKEVPLKKILEAHFAKPVYVNNDANCFTVGEKYFGKGKRYQNLVGVTLGTGLGAGLIISNRLYAGPNCGAGEFGAMAYRDRTIEYYCSGQFFTNVHGIDGKEAFRRAERGDRKALAIFREFGTHLGEAMKTILFAVDPEAIIFGGSVSRAFPFFEESMWTRLRTFPYRKPIDRLSVRRSSRKMIALLGAAALHLDARKGQSRGGRRKNAVRRTGISL